MKKPFRTLLAGITLATIIGAAGTLTATDLTASPNDTAWGSPSTDDTAWGIEPTPLEPAIDQLATTLQDTAWG